MNTHENAFPYIAILYLGFPCYFVYFSLSQTTRVISSRVRKLSDTVRALLPKFPNGQILHFIPSGLLHIYLYLYLDL